MKTGLLSLWALAALPGLPAGAWAQEPHYPITVVPPGKGPYEFPQGYQTPWDKIEMLVTEKLSPNLYSCTVRRVSTPRIPTLPGAGSRCSSAPMAC